MTTEIAILLLCLVFQNERAIAETRYSGYQMEKDGEGETMDIFLHAETILLISELKH